MPVCSYLCNDLKLFFRVAGVDVCLPTLLSTHIKIVLKQQFKVDSGRSLLQITIPGEVGAAVTVALQNGLGKAPISRKCNPYHL